MAEQLGGRSRGSANQRCSSNRQKLGTIFQLPDDEDNDDDNDDRGVTSETLVSICMLGYAMMMIL